MLLLFLLRKDYFINIFTCLQFPLFVKKEKDEKYIHASQYDLSPKIKIYSKVLRPIIKIYSNVFRLQFYSNI